MQIRNRFWQDILSKKMLVCIFTGFSSGLPLYILISLLPAWLKSYQLDLKAIGLFAKATVCVRKVKEKQFVILRLL